LAKQAKEAKQQTNTLAIQNWQTSLTEFKAFTEELDGKLTPLRDKPVLRVDGQIGHPVQHW
jgi:hypothetical protein